MHLFRHIQRMNFKLKLFKNSIAQFQILKIKVCIAIYHIMVTLRNENCLTRKVQNKIL